MLAHVNFPLTNSQLTDFFLDHEYTTYFTLQQALNELREAGLIKMETIHNSSRYEITKEGDDTLSFFGNNVSSAIITDIDTYLKENKFNPIPSSMFLKLPNNECTMQLGINTDDQQPSQMLLFSIDEVKCIASTLKLAYELADTYELMDAINSMSGVLDGFESFIDAYDKSTIDT